MMPAVTARQLKVFMNWTNQSSSMLNITQEAEAKAAIKTL